MPNLPSHTAELEKALALLRESDTIVLTTHVNPDGDGIGSELALSRALRLFLSRHVTILNPNPTPGNYEFLDAEREIRTFEPPRDESTMRDADLIVVVDTSQPGRLRNVGDAMLRSRARRLCIDHHLDPADFADACLIDEEACATGEILLPLVEELTAGNVDIQMATCLYAAIMTDTGSFRYPRTDAHLHRMVARLIEYGADPVAIYDRIYDQWSAGRFQLLGRALSGLEILCEGRLAVMTVTREMLRDTGTTETETDNFSTYPMSIGGVVLGILFIELADGVKMSFRSKGDVWANQLAQAFGGNGHKNAAGARVFDRPLGEIRNDVLRMTPAFLDQFPASKRSEERT